MQILKKKTTLKIVALLSALLAGGSSAQSTASVTARPCPWSCQIARVPVANCREWRQGNMCYVEDVSKRTGTQEEPASHIYQIPDHDILLESRHGQVLQPPRVNSKSNHPSRACDRLKGSHIAPPRIVLDTIDKIGLAMEETYQVRGTVEGICIVEAGIYIAGRRQRDLNIAMQPYFQRHQFSLTVKQSNDPQVRVYNVNGDSDIVSIF